MRKGRQIKEGKANEGKRELENKEHFVEGKGNEKKLKLWKE